MQLTGQKFRVRKVPPRSNPWRMLLWFLLIASGLYYWNRLESGVLRSPLEPPPPPTAPAAELARQGDALFDSGALEAAIEAYRQAVALQPEDSRLWAELSRIQVYSSTALTTQAERQARLAQALESAEEAIQVDPDSSRAHAARALALDWSAAGAGVEREQLLNRASEAAVRALQLDPGNPLALSYYAEVLVDQQKWSQALDAAQHATSLAPSSLDAHRVQGYVLESNGNYEQAIQAYQRAIAINPHLGFLYILVGANYRRLGANAANPLERESLVEQAIDYFEKAAELNPDDKVPWLAIGKTYYQLGDYRAAERALLAAVELDPTDPDIYGRLGLIRYHNKNYEGAIVDLGCTVDGCPEHPDSGRAVEPMLLSSDSLEYYYTYASVLTYFAGADNDHCQHAVDLFQRIRAFAPNDPTAMDVVAVGLQACQELAPLTS